MLNTVVLHNIFVENVMHVFFFQDSQINIKFKRTVFTFVALEMSSLALLINLMHP